MRFGKPLRGEMHPLAKISRDQAQDAREKMNTGQMSLREAGRCLGCTPTWARKIRDGLAHNDKHY
jgi:hypothetical protein